tara:strand:+ start:270 stop:854 length:585 start_codon:yes stop_codon:yes gene_type:complete
MSISIYPSVFSKTIDGRRVISRHGEEQVLEKCWVCKGTGKEEAYMGKPGDGPSLVDCDYCKGKGERLEWRGKGPEMNLSNTNAFAVFSFLGIQEPDYSGTIMNKDLQKYLMLLYQVKSGEQDSGLESPGRTSGGNRRTEIQKDPETGLDTIKKVSDGPVLYHMGRSASQVRTYIDKLINIFEYARDNKVNVSWA